MEITGFLGRLILLDFEEKGVYIFYTQTIRYFADFKAVRGLLAFLMEDCSGGNSEICHPIIDEIARAY